MAWPSIPLAIRFERHMTALPEAPGCWIWTGKRANKCGYGRMTFGRKRGKALEEDAHRAAYRFFVGPIPAGKHVLHKCDVPACIRPDHLYLGTQLENMRDVARRGRFNRKLTWARVHEIRRLKAEGQPTFGLAHQFNVSPSMIRRIVAGKSWPA